MATEPLTPDALIALARLFHPDAEDIRNARNLIVPGKRKVRGGVQFAGTLTVGEPFERAGSPRLSALQAMTLMVVDLVTRAGMSKPAALALVERVLEQSMTSPAKDEDLEKSEDPVVLDVIRTKLQIQKRIADRMSRETVPGRITWSGFVESRAPAPAFAAAFLDP